MIKEMWMDLLYPPRCPLCQKIVAETGLACPQCGKILRPLTEPLCKKCGRELYDERKEYCLDCENSSHQFESGIACFVYRDAIQESVFRFKYQNKREYSRFYGNEMAARITPRLRVWQPDLVVPVPLHAHRRRSRGFNQAELLAREIAGRLDLPFKNDLLRRCKNTIPQKQLTKSERRKNLKEAFELAENVVGEPNVLLIDDIYTTGSTVDAAARTLKQGGAGAVYCAVLCIGEKSL